MNEFKEDIQNILIEAESGVHESCCACPWRPMDQNMAFGISCELHGVSWSQQERTISFQIVQDPGDTTPADTGKLCFVCNSSNPTDRTAQHNYDLWKAGVSLDWEEIEDDHFLKRHYWTNAIMHGASKESGLRGQIKDARHHCGHVLMAQLSALTPQVIITSGKVAAESLYENGVLSEKWDRFRDCFERGAYYESMGFNDSVVSIFSTYHTGITVVNTYASKMYNHNTEQLLHKKIDELPRNGAANNFLSKYSDVQHKTHQGMRVLLLHWLDIGKKIRKEIDFV